MDSMPFLAKELPMAIETNEPIPKPPSNHIAPLIGTIILIASIGVAIALFMTQTFGIEALGGTIGGGYLLYLILAVFCNKSATYLRNSKSFDEYERVYYAMRDSKAYFRFHVSCYHYQTHVHHHHNKDAQGNTNHSTSTERRKIVTHTATQNLFPSGCQDIGGHIDELYDGRELIFFKYMPRFQFDSLNSQRYFENSFSNFKMMHNRDMHQDSSYQFIIPNFIERICFFTNGKKSGSGLFYLCGFLGLAYFYLLCKQRKVSRYEINIVKRITF